MKRIVTTMMVFLQVMVLSGQGTMLLRQPTLSDSQIVFVYADDLWSVDRGEQYAFRLTTSTGTETLPHFSPDGEWIAFTAEYEGNTDVYAIPARGGEPVRLTWHPGGDYVTGWTPGSDSIVFRSARERQPTQINRLYAVSLDGGFPSPLPPRRAAYGELSSDRKHLAYLPFTEWDSEWRNYRGGQAQPIWILDLEDLSLEQTPRTNNERHMDPVWVDRSVFFLSERDFASNIWSFHPETGELRQHTFHADFDVKSLDAHGPTVVYEQGGTLHLLDTKTDRITDLEITVKGDFHWARTRWEEVEPQRLTHASLSPTGKRALFEYRGDIYTVPAEEGDWRNITRTPGVADRYPVWSPQGDKIAWFSDASGEYQLEIVGQDGISERRSIPLPNPTFYFRPDWSPDGKYIAYTDTDYNLWYVNLEDEEVRKVDTERYAHPFRSMNPVWSPDSKWIAYARLMDNHFKVIRVHNTETGETHQLTDAMADSYSPVWDASGKYLYFIASTDFGLKSGWLDMSNYDVDPTRRLYMMILNREDPSPFLPEPGNEPVEEESPGKKKDKKEDDGENGSVTVEIDPENIHQRIIAMDVPARDYAFTMAGPENTVFFGERKQHEPGFTLHKYDVNEEKSSEFMPGIREAGTSHDRQHLLYRAGSNWGIVSTSGSSAKPGDGTLALSDLRYRVEPRAEWEQIFREGWRFQRDFLYVDNVHGAPWEKVYEWYQPWVKHIRHRSDLNYLVDILGGEVAVGHSFTRGGDMPERDNVPVGLLGADFEVDRGKYRIAHIYTGETWNPGLEGPLAIPGIEAREGDYLLEVNGKPVDASTNLYRVFEGTAGRQIQITLSGTPGDEKQRTLLVTPLSNEYRLRYVDWIEGNRKKVDEWSNGKLAYVYLPNTSGGGFTHFNRYYFAQQDKKGAVIDERNNSGGSAADYMVDIMNRELHGYFNSKVGDRKPFTSPISGIWGPKVMIINEMAGSGGDYLPYMFKKMDIGPLVGTTTWGGLVGTWDTPAFIDGGAMVAPRGGFFDVNGEWAVEGEGVAPDIRVIQHPREVINGHDPQLEQAVETALELLETGEVELQEEPPPPVRWKRPDYFEEM